MKNKIIYIIFYFWVQSLYSEGFKAVKIKPQNTVSAEKMLIIAYGAFFILILGYILFITRKLSLIDDKLSKLELIQQEEEEND